MFDDIQPIVLDHARKDRLVVMAGAGISMSGPTHLPGWSRLNEMIMGELSNHYESYIGKINYTEIIQEFINQRRTDELFPSDYQAQIIHENSGTRYFESLQSLDVDMINSSHNGLAWLAKKGVIKFIVTTNFERLIEKSLDLHGVEYEVSYDPDTFEQCNNKIKGERELPLQIVKVHGCVRDPSSLIDTLKQRLQGRNSYLEKILLYLLSNYYWVYAGFSAYDLTTDKDYLQILSHVEVSPGITYIEWPGSDKLGPGAQILINEYGKKATVTKQELSNTWSSISHKLGYGEIPPNSYEKIIDVPKLVKNNLEKWSQTLNPSEVVNCLAAIYEANGETNNAFKILDKFWNSVHPRDRRGPDFERYRFLHGKYGIGIGRLSINKDLKTDSGFESLQNLLRVSENEPRAISLAGMAFLWDADVSRAFHQLEMAYRIIQGELSPLQTIDIWLDLGEAHYITLDNPQMILNTWLDIYSIAKKEGDLPRMGRIAFLASLYIADFSQHQFLDYKKEVFDPLFDRCKRLNDPSITAFYFLAQGRYLVKNHSPESFTCLEIAADYFERAGKSPWYIFSKIEQIKSLIDLHRLDESKVLILALNEEMDNWQILLILFEEAIGQLHLVEQNQDAARQSFLSARNNASKLNLVTQRDRLQQYLNI